MMNRVIVLQELRLSSERLPRKILEPVEGERLIDRGLRKLRSLAEMTGNAVAVVAWQGDAEVVEAIRNHELPWIPKSEASSKAESWSQQMDGWQRELNGLYDWVLFLNVVCHPFISLDTLTDMITRAQDSSHPWVSVIEERGQVWEGNKALLNAASLLSSKTSPHFCRPAHLATACAIADLNETNRILRPKPQIFQTKLIERIDIDTREDLEFARVVAAGLQAKSRRLEVYA